MKALITILAVASVAVLAGCASTSERSASAAPGKSSPFNVDDAYVSEVNRIAVRRGIHVTWVNMPTKRTEKDDSDKKN